MTQESSITDEQIAEMASLQRALRTLRSELGFSRDDQRSVELHDQIVGKQARLDALFPTRATPIAE